VRWTKKCLFIFYIINFINFIFIFYFHSLIFSMKYALNTEGEERAITLKFKIVEEEDIPPVESKVLPAHYRVV
jgi:hypothetical protein